VEVLRQIGANATRLAMVGFDDFALADLLRPGVTVIAQDSATIGRTAVELLLARSADPTRPVRTVTVPVSLIPRGSGELAPE
jgi:LacI family transcriptional regulator